MRKLKLVVISLLFCFIVFMFVVNGSITKAYNITCTLLGNPLPNYAIIVADDFYYNTKLQEFINWKQNQGYVVVLTNVSSIYESYLLTLSSNNVFSITLDDELWIEEYPDVIPDYYDENEFANVWYYLNEPVFDSLEYILLVGDPWLVPTGLFYQSVTSSGNVLRLTVAPTDHYYAMKGYSEETWDYDTGFIPDRCVGRWLVETNEELDKVIDGTMLYKHNVSEKSYVIAGPSANIPEDEWNSTINYIINSVNQSIYQPVYYLYEGTKDEVTNTINSENDILIFVGHGRPNRTAIDDNWILYANDCSSLFDYKNPNIVIAVSCLTGNFFPCAPENRSLARSFLTNTETVVYIGCTLVTSLYGAGEYATYLFKDIENQKTIGKAFKFAKINAPVHERLFWTLFGDPSLNLMTYVPPSTGWLELSFLVDGQQPIKNAVYGITFPNGTIKEYECISKTILFCPVGAYTINCIYEDKLKTEVVNIELDLGTIVVFDFVASVSTGTIRIDSNLNVPVNIEGQITDTKMTPFILSNVPIGYYVFNATYIDMNGNTIESLTWSVNLLEGQDISHTFEFDIYTPPIDYFWILEQNLPFFILGIVALLIIKW